MLVLLRKPGQTIMIGDDIAVSVLGIHRLNQVKLGINAPHDIRVLRKELYTSSPESGLNRLICLQ